MAVAYDKAFYIGQVTAIISQEEMDLDFIAHTEDEGLLKWPWQKDCATVHKKYVFSSTPKMQAVGKQFFYTTLLTLSNCMSITKKST